MLSKPNILVCTDFSSFSHEALKLAEEIRKKTNGILHVLHVSEHTVMWDWMPEGTVPNVMEGQAQLDLMKTLGKKLEDQMRSSNAKGEAHISLGVPAAVIIQETLDRKIDLIVMGHKGQTGGRFHMGSLAEKIVASSPVPVLVAKTSSPISKVGALVDPNGPMDQILAWAEELSFVLSTRLEAVSLFPDIAARYIGIGKLGFSTELLSLTKEQKETVVSEVRERIKKHMTKYSEANIRVEVSAERKLAYHLNALLTEDKVDLAVMKRHQAEFLEKVLIGSETRRMIELFPGNLFILPP